MAKQLNNPKPNPILGQVVDKLNRPLPNLIIRAYNRDIRSSEEPLDEGITNMEIQQTRRASVEALAQMKLLQASFIVSLKTV